MKTQIIIVIGMLLLIGNVSAQTIYGGNSYSFEINLTNPVYIIKDNSSNLIGLNVSFENGNITISPALNYKPDSFTMIFFDEVTREVVKIVYIGGGGRSIKYVDRNVTIYEPIYINNTEVIEGVCKNCGDKYIYNGEKPKSTFQFIATGIAIFVFVYTINNMYNRFKKRELSKNGE